MDRGRFRAIASWRRRTAVQRMDQQGEKLKGSASGGVRAAGTPAAPPTSRKGLQTSELFLVGVLLACAVAVVVVIVIVFVSSFQMYHALSNSVDDTVKRASSTATAHIQTDVEGIGLVGEYLGSVVSRALSTPRVPETAAERDSYVSFQSDLDGGMTMMFDVAAGTYTPEVAQVVYHAEKYTQATRDWMTSAYFWGTGGLGPEFAGVIAAWGKSIFQAYCVTPDGFAVLYPYSDLRQFYVAFNDYPFITQSVPAFNPNNLTIWQTPYADAVTHAWVVSFMHPAFGYLQGATAESYVISCGADMFITDVIDYTEEVSENMPWNSYVVVVASDGTVLSIPGIGSKDWGIPAGTTYAEITMSPTYNATQWNVFNNPKLDDVGDAYKRGPTGVTTVSLPGGERLMSWGTVNGTDWIVLAVINRQKALAPQHKALILVSVVAAVLGAMLVASAAAIAAYVAVQRKYSRMSHKISDLNMQLDDAKRQLKEHNGDSFSNAAIVGDLRIDIEALAQLSQFASTEQMRAIRDIKNRLLHHDFTVVKPTYHLNADERQFVMDCGMRVQDDSESLTGSVAPTATDADVDDLDDGMAGSQCATRGAAVLRGVIVALPAAIDITSWDFDVFNLRTALGDGAHVLTSVVINLLQNRNMLGEGSGTGSDFLLDRDRIVNFLEFLDETYCGSIDDRFQVVPAFPHHSDDGSGDDLLTDIKPTPGSMFPPVNPYHNNLHATDVTQAFCHMLTAVLGTSRELHAVVTKVDIAACVLAGTVHDYGHPGRNSVFLRNALTDSHVFFAGDSPLERMHFARSFGMLLHGSDRFAALKGLSRAQTDELVLTASKLVLATDMAHHAEIVGSFDGWVAARQKKRETASTEDLVIDDRGKILILQMLMKASDLGNAFRNWPVCREWTMRLSDEFLQQGITEKNLGLPVSRFMDGKVSAAKMQETFIPLIVGPMLRALATEFPVFQFFEDKAKENLQHWKNES
eukprot:TRINITY_DN5051_c0_g1_i2.p1 TRINITY_DN5051_c0_g1~~TRINITY_DN5051_c0_g1_i2.p1  ORF type:complete len:976 (-),score=247.63 TRINITY_DN5051_c0_g1_i2:113-3040(-)